MIRANETVPTDGGEAVCFAKTKKATAAQSLRNSRQ